MDKCKRCKRTSNDTELNYEGKIHHGGKLVCKDQRSCKRARRKMKKNEGKKGK